MSASLTDALERDSALNLDQAAVGCNFQVKSLEGPECRQLREIGFCEEMRIRKIAHGRTLLCKVCGTRLALSRHLARQVQVTPCP
jgi:ferrous iron transport protein A